MSDSNRAPARMVKLTQRLMTGRAITSYQIRILFGVSRATAKRDMALLRECLPVTECLIKRRNGNHDREMRLYSTSGA